MAGNQTPTHAKDAALIMKAAGAVGESAASATVIDLGPGIGYRAGKVIIDITALEIASNDELYDIIVQGSPDSDFGTAGNIVELAAISLSAKEYKRSDSDRDDATGRRSILFENLNEAGTPLRYLRLYTVVAGTIGSGGINYSAYLVPIPLAA